MALLEFVRNRPSAQADRFDRLVRPHLPALFRTAYRYTGRREDAEDLVQDLLTKLYPRTSELEQIEDLKPWLTRALYNAFIDGVRRTQRAPELVDVDDEVLEGPHDPQSDFLTAEQRQALITAIDRLNPEHRAVVMLHLVEGHSLPELASLLDVQIGTLKSRLHRAKAQLQDSLKFMEPFSPAERVTPHEL
jgi:RNA polymerase sigma-70 factor, ECF subfamily